MRSNVVTLEERIASVENDSKALQDKVTLLTEEKTAVENETALLKESLKTADMEKQVGCS